MTAKEALREIVDEMSEEDARKWLRAIEPALITEQGPFLTARELLRLPLDERGAIIRAQLALVSQADIDQMVAEVEEWTVGTAGDIDLIDE